MCIKTAELEGSWSNACLKDLQWLTIFPSRLHVGKTYTMKEWIECVLDNPAKFKKNVMWICKSAFANVVTHWARSKTLKEGGATRLCHVCNRSFETKQSHSAHLYRCHGIKSMERRYVISEQCSCCLLHLWSRERCVNHIKRSATCRENLLLRPPLLSDEQADELDLLERSSFTDLKSKGLRRHAATKPCVQAQGPLLPIIIDPSRFSQHHPLGVGSNRRV